MASLRTLGELSHVPAHKIVSVNYRIELEIRRLPICHPCPAGSREYSVPRQGQG